MMFSPSTQISPLVGGSSMLMARRSVLFPVPEGPMMLITSPFSISQFTSLRTVIWVPSGLVKVLLKCLILIMLLLS